MSFRLDDEKLLEKYKAIWTKIEDVKDIKSNALPVYDDRCKKTKIRTYADKIYTYFCDLNVSENNKKCESFYLLLVYNEKYYLQVCLDSGPYKTVNKQMTDYLDGNLFEG